MADWFETRFREPADSGQPAPEFVARMRALVAAEWHADEAAVLPDEIDAHDREADIIMLETDAPRTEDQPAAARRLSSRGRLLLAAAAVVVVVAAATIASRGDEPAGFATTEPTSPTATTTDLYGDVVGEHSGPILEWMDSETSCLHVECSLNRYLRERYITFHESLTDLDRALAELPSPPDEIATLVASTSAQVDDTLASVDLLLTCTASSGPCGEQRFAAEAAYENLRPVLAAWRPFI